MKFTTKFNIGSIVKYRRDISKQRPCPKCKGKGKDKGSKRKDGYVCGKCLGKGEENYNDYVNTEGIVTDIDINSSKEDTYIYYTVENMHGSDISYILEKDIKPNTKTKEV